MYFSRLTLDLSKTEVKQLIHLIDRGTYALHQMLWRLFSDAEERNFLFRLEEKGKSLVIYVLSETLPQKSEIFSIKTKEFNPQLRAGEVLVFSLRANPTVSRHGKKFDVLMDSRIREKSERDLLLVQEDSAIDWLKRQGCRFGFELCSAFVEKPHLNVFKGKDGNIIQYRSVDFSGILKVKDPVLFHRCLYEGVGRAKAFGCGLMLIQRRSEIWKSLL